MPRNIFRKWMPDPNKVKALPGLGFLRHLLDDPNLFHLNRHSVSVAFFVGLFCCFLPIPGQIPIATLGTLILRCNLPIAILLVWISNPFTFPIIFYGAYLLGSRILQRPINDFSIELSWTWLETGFQAVWEPLILGCILCSLFFGCLGFLTVQWSWRWMVTSKWKARKKLRAENGIN